MKWVKWHAFYEPAARGRPPLDFFQQTCPRLPVELHLLFIIVVFGRVFVWVDCAHIFWFESEITIEIFQWLRDWMKEKTPITCVLESENETKSTLHYANSIHMWNGMSNEIAILILLAFFCIPFPFLFIMLGCMDAVFFSVYHRTALCVRPL